MSLLQASNVILAHSSMGASYDVSEVLAGKKWIFSQSLFYGSSKTIPVKLATSSPDAPNPKDSKHTMVNSVLLTNLEFRQDFSLGNSLLKNFGHHCTLWYIR